MFIILPEGNSSLPNICFSSSYYACKYFLLVFCCTVVFFCERIKFFLYIFATAVFTDFSKNSTDQVSIRPSSTNHYIAEHILPLFSCCSGLVCILVLFVFFIKYFQTPDWDSKPLGNILSSGYENNC